MFWTFLILYINVYQPESRRLLSNCVKLSNISKECHIPRVRFSLYSILLHPHWLPTNYWSQSSSVNYVCISLGVRPVLKINITSHNYIMKLLEVEFWKNITSMVYVYFKSLMESNSYRHKRVDCPVPETRKWKWFKLFGGHMFCTTLSNETHTCIHQWFWWTGGGSGEGRGRDMCPQIVRETSKG